jgi:hypothetical protein
MFGVVLVSFFYFEGWNERLGGGAVNSIWLARAAAVFIFFYVYYCFSSINRKFSYLLFIIAVLMFFFIILAKSKGPLIFLFVTLVVYFVLSRKLLFFLKFAIVPVILIFLVFLYLDSVFWERLISLSDPSDSESIRISLYFAALEMFYQNPLGGGSGYFGRHFSQFSNIDYPHNAMLESLVEYGVYFTACLYFLILSTLFGLGKKCYKQSGRCVDSLLFMIAIYSFLNSMVSGGISAPKDLYFIMFYWFFCMLFGNKTEVKQANRQSNDRVELSSQERTLDYLLEQKAR